MIKIQKFILCLLSSLIIQIAWAYDFESNGFYYNLNSNDLTVSVTYGDNAYAGDVYIPDSVTYKGRTMKVVSVDEEAFNNCTGLTSIHFGGNITSIGENAFNGCNKLSKLIIPSNISYIGNSAFYGCINLKDLTIEDSESTLRFGTNGTDSPSCAFDSKLNYLYYGRILGKPEWEKVYDLDNSELKTILIGSKVTSIDGFGGSLIEQITIPASVTSIGKGAFKDCTELRHVYFEDGKNTLIWEGAYNKSINGTWTTVSPFYDCPIEDAYIGRIITPTTNNIYLSYSDGPFDRTSIMDITISDALTSLCGFNYCTNLKTIKIPSAVTQLYGFRGSSSLISITLDAITPPSVYGYNPFENNTYLNATLSVPKGSIESYQANQIWGKFFDIQEITDSSISRKKCQRPTIRYAKGELMFTTETEGAICHSDITDSDITSYNGNEVHLSVTYNISVYSTKPGYENSDVMTATLCWIDVEPRTEGIDNGIAQVKAKPVLIQSQNGMISVNGLDDGTRVSIYDINGVQEGSAVSHNGQATASTNLSPGSIVIVKIGEKSLKVQLR